MTQGADNMQTEKGMEEEKWCLKKTDGEYFSDFIHLLPPYLKTGA